MPRLLFRVALLSIYFFLLSTISWAQITGFIKLDDGSASPGAVIVYIFQPNEPIISTVQLAIIETIPDHTTFDAASSDPAWASSGCTNGAPAGTTCQVTVTVGSGGGIPAFAVRATNPVASGVEAIENTVLIETGGQTFSASRSTVLQAAPDLVLLKDDVGTSAAPGSTIRYNLDYRNDGTQTATGVVIEEFVPLHTTFESGDSSPGWSCVDGASAGTMCQLSVGILDGGGAASRVSFTVRVEPILPAGVTEISNLAEIFDDGANGSDQNPRNNQSIDMTPLTADAAPDLVIAKDDVGTSAAPGSTVVYNLDFRNDGAQAATGIEIQERVPAHTVFDANNSTPGWRCDDGAPPDTLCILEAGSLAGGGGADRALFAVRVESVLPSGLKAITNTATIVDDGKNGADLNPANNQSTDLTPLTADAAPDLVIVKDDVEATAAPGEAIIYQLTFANDGAQAATGVVLEEQVPAHTSFHAASSSPGWTCPDGSPAGALCARSVGSLAGGGGSGEATFAVIVEEVLPAGVEQIENTISIRDDGKNGNDLNPRNNRSIDVTPLTADAAPDLVVAKDDEGTSAAPDSTIHYNLLYRNDGTQAATGVVLEERVPGHTRFDAAGSTNGWSCTPDAPAGTVCDLLVGSLAGGGEVGEAIFAVIVDPVLPAGVTEIENTIVIADDGTNGEDLNPTNNTSTDVTPLTADAAPDLVIAKDDEGTSAAPGSTIVYRLDFRNDGAQAATGVALAETVPRHTRFDATSSTPGWSCRDGAVAGTGCEWPVGSLAGGGGAGTVDFAVQVDVALPAGIRVIVNTVTIADDGRNGDDLNLTNNQSTDLTPLTQDAAPDLVITKTDGGISTTPGSIVIYTLDFYNDGPQAATGVMVEETVPRHTTFDAASASAGWRCPDGAPAGTQCVFDAGSLSGGGGSGQASFAVRVDGVLPAGVTEIENTASIADDGRNGPDLNPTNNQAIDVTPLIGQRTAPDLVITKDDGGISARPGETIRYHLGIANIGNQTATGVVIDEHVPAATAFDAAASSAGWSCPDAAPAGTLCHLSLGTLAAGGGTVESVTFAVRVDPIVSAGIETITNIATVFDDGRNGRDLDPTNNQDRDTTPVIRDIGVDVAVTGNAAYVVWPRLRLTASVRLVAGESQAAPGPEPSLQMPSGSARAFKADRDQRERNGAFSNLVRVRLVIHLDGAWSVASGEGWSCEQQRCERLVTISPASQEFVLAVDRRGGPSPWRWRVEAWPVAAPETRPGNNVSEGALPVFAPDPTP